MVKALTASQKRKKLPYGKKVSTRKRKTRSPSSSVSYNPPLSDEEYNKNSPPYIPHYSINNQINTLGNVFEKLAVRNPNRRTRNKRLRKKINKRKKSIKMR